MKSCWIVGAGMAGLTAANRLQNNNWRAVVVDKGRGVGGRMATRRIPAGDNEVRADHGAQFITVRDERFQAAMDGWIAGGSATAWFERDGHTRYRGASGMNGIPRAMAAGLDVRTGMRIDHVAASDGRWTATAESGECFEADALLLTPPAPQTLALCRPFADQLPAEIRAELMGIEFDPCLALLLVLDGPSAIPAPGYERPAEGPIAWIADNCQKGLDQRTALTIHASPAFSREHWQTPEEVVTQLLTDAARSAMGESTVVTSQLHRWRYSQPVRALEADCLFAAAPAPIAFAGDAFAGPRVEGAFLSGMAAAERILNGE